ncbi:MAG: hypothetical protein HY401_05120 [Elusimicrobia bacterium]|nr:hypothetical protein [Elusimicrobiota bacterium]
MLVKTIKSLMAIGLALSLGASSVIASEAGSAGSGQPNQQTGWKDNVVNPFDVIKGVVGFTGAAILWRTFASEAPMTRTAKAGLAVAGVALAFPACTRTVAGPTQYINEPGNAYFDSYIYEDSDGYYFVPPAFFMEENNKLWFTVFNYSDYEPIRLEFWTSNCNGTKLNRLDQDDIYFNEGVQFVTAGVLDYGTTLAVVARWSNNSYTDSDGSAYIDVGRRCESSSAFAAERQRVADFLANGKPTRKGRSLNASQRALLTRLLNSQGVTSASRGSIFNAFGHRGFRTHVIQLGRTAQNEPK